MRFLIFIFLVFLLPFSSAFGAKSEWRNVGLDTKIRLISSDELNKDGSVFVGLEIKMPKKIKTYWRIPGEAGIPAQLDISGSNNIISHEMFWPFPVREEQYGFLNFVYYGKVILPIKLQLDKKAGQTKLKADVFLGICSDICIPVQEVLELDLNLKKIDKTQRARLKIANSLTPAVWDKKEKPIKNAIIDLKTNKIEVEVDGDIVDISSIIIDNDNPNVLFSLPQHNLSQPGLPQYSLSTSLVSFEIINEDEIKNLIDKPIRFTFQTSDGAFETFIILE